MREWQRVGRAERDGVGHRDVQIVEQARCQAGSDTLGSDKLREQEIGRRRIRLQPPRRSTTVDVSRTTSRT